jgi:2-polyprenyl-6-methoxyphenol hydroxylase-like FAD-dependent oxidoreductase
MAKRLGQRAVVIGGSMAGLMTARVLADYFDSVIVLERDHIEAVPAPHKSIPQGNHLHLLLPGGQLVMKSLYPDLLHNLERMGSKRARIGQDFVAYLSTGKAYNFSGSVREQHDLGLEFYCQSRGLLEYAVRQCTLQHKNVKLQSDCNVQELAFRDWRVEGVRYTTHGTMQSLATDLVVDAGGRGSHASRWLMDMGFQTPAETTIGVDLAYASAHFLVPKDYDRRECLMVFDRPPPDSINSTASAKSAVMEIIEGDVFHLTLAGRFGDYPPRDEAGFMAFAKRLRTPKLYELIGNAERVGEITTYRFPSAIRRHYERLSTFPDGFAVLGDAIASFNPIYGQGMSSAALQAQALSKVLAERASEQRGLSHLALSFFPKVAEVVTNPWVLARNLDLAYAKTQGERPPDLAAQLGYMGALDAIAAEDVEVLRLFWEVLSLCKPVSALSEEPLRSRVVAEQRKLAERYAAA